MPHADQPVMRVAEHVYLEGHRAGALEASRGGVGGGVPEWPLEGVEADRIAELIEPGVMVLPEVLGKLEREQAQKALDVWRGFDAFCREHLGLDAEKILWVVLEPAVELEALTERLGMEPDADQVRGIADGLAQTWAIVEEKAA